MEGKLTTYVRLSVCLSICMSLVVASLSFYSAHVSVHDVWLKRPFCLSLLFQALFADLRPYLLWKGGAAWSLEACLKQVREVKTVKPLWNCQRLRKANITESTCSRLRFLSWQIGQKEWHLHAHVHLYVYENVYVHVHLHDQHLEDGEASLRRAASGETWWTPPHNHNYNHTATHTLTLHTYHTPHLE